MPSILNLKFKGNKSFVAFSNLIDAESLTQTWKVCSKVASFLEQGQRLENLSWRLWHLQNLIVDTDNAKSRREFKKLSKCMGDKLDKEKGRSIEELSAPDFRRNHSTDMIKQRAAEKERNREAYLNAPGTIKRMQFTFSVDQPTASVSSAPVKKPDTKPSAELSKRSRATARVHHEDATMTNFDTSSVASDPISCESVISTGSYSSHSQSLHFPTLFNDSFGPSALLYAAPTLTTPMTYGEGFAPSCAADDDQFRISRPTIELPLDEILFDDDSSSDSGWASAINALSAATITKFRDTAKDSQTGSIDKTLEAHPAAACNITSAPAGQQQDVIMYTVALSQDGETGPNQQPVSTTPPLSNASSQYLTNFIHDAITRSTSLSTTSSGGADDEAGSSYAEEEDDEIDQPSPAPSTAKRAIFKNFPPESPVAKEDPPETISPSRLFSIHGARSGTPNTTRPTLTLRTQGAMTTRSSGPGASVTNLNPAILRANGNSGPGGVKAECSNCGATHTPLWRRGLNDELNCNACGLYCKLHKRPRPKSMRSSHGESRTHTTPRPETVDVVGTSRPRSLSTKGPSFTESQPTRPSVAAQCYNCHTTATPLWRKDDEGKTVCNACGLYYKLHGSARPISMKSDVIRKRSRHDARRASQSGFDEMTSASPEISRRTSPARESSPTLAPDSTTQMSYDFGEDPNEFRNSTSELAGALGSTTTNNNNSNVNTESTSLFSTFPLSFPGPYHPDYLMQLYGLNSDPLPFSSVETTTETDPSMSPRSNKRRRMSTDSATEPPSSAASYSSYNGSSISSSSSGEGYTSPASTPSHSKKNSMDFSFSPFSPNGSINQGPALRGSGNTFWHPPMMPQNQADAEAFWHPPLVPPTTHASSVSFNARAKDISTSDSASVNSSSRRSVSSSPRSNTDDSAMDFLQHGMIQDDDLFSAYLHAHDEKIASNAENGSSNAMYVDSYF